jgi:PAS domain S-box-containing protein
MKTNFSFDAHIVRKYSLTHVLLSALIGGDFKVGWLEITFKMISDFQILAMLVLYPYQYLRLEDLDSLNRFLKNLASVVTFSEFINVTDNSLGSNILLGLILFLIGTVVFFLVAFVITYCIGKTLPSSLLKVWINVSVVHYTTLFLLVHQFSLAMIKEGNDGTAHLFGSTSSTLFVGLGVVLIILNLAFSLMTSRFVYEPIKSHYIAAIRTTIPDLISIFFKTLDLFFVFFINDTQTQKFIRLVVMVVLLGYRMIIYLNQCPYYYFQPMRLFQAFNCVQMGVVLVNFIVILVNEGKIINGNNLAYMILIICLFFAKASDVRMEAMVTKYGMIDIDNISSKDHFYKKLLAVDHILEEGSISAQMEKKSRESFAEFLFYGIVKAHKIKCKRLACGCDLVLETGKMAERIPLKEDQRTFMRAFRFNLTLELFAAFKEPEVQLTLANFLFENKVDSYAAAITLIHQLNLDRGSIELKVVSVKLLEKVEKMVLTNYDSSIDMQEIVDYQALSFNLRKSVEANIRRYIKFWEIYKGAEPSAKELYDLSSQLNREAEKVADTWNKIMTKHSLLAYKDYLLYGLYQGLTRASPFSAEKTLQKFFALSAVYSSNRQRELLLTPQSVSEPQNVLIYITMQKEKIGNITFTTRNIEEKLGYASFELLDRNINELMPRFYRQRHNKVLRAHIDYGRTNIINKNRAIYVRKKDGFIMPAALYVSLFPYFQKQLLYLGIIRPIQTYDEFILVRPDGVIDSFTRTVAKILNLETDSKRRLRLKYISPELDNLHKGFNYLRAGQWSKLRGLSLSKRDFSFSNSSRTKQSNTIPQTRSNGENEQSRTSYSQSEGDTARKSFQDRNTQDLSGLMTGDLEEHQTTAVEGEELINPNEFDDWTRIYELYTSTGVPAYFYKFSGKHGVKPNTNQKIEFTTIIIEEKMLGSSLRIFRLQTISLDADQEEENNVFQEDLTAIESNVNQPVKKDAGANQEKNLMVESNILQKHLINESLPNPQDMTLSAISSGPDGDMKNNLNLMDLSANFEGLSEDHEILAFRDGILGGGARNEKLTAFEKFAEHDLEDAEEEHGVLLSKSGHLVPKQQLEKASPQAIAPTTGKGVLLVLAPTLEKQITIPSLQGVQEGPQKAQLRVDSSRDDKMNIEEKSKDQHDLKRFFEKHKILYADHGGGPNSQEKNSSNHSSAQSARISSKIERAVYTTEVDKTIKSLNWIAILFYLITVGLLIFDQVATNNNLSKLQANVEVQKFSTQKLFLIIEIDRRARIINLMQRGLIPKARLDSTDDIPLNLDEMLESSNYLSQNNTEIRLSVNKIDSSQRQRFYDNIPVKERGGSSLVRYMNSFDASTEIINSVIQLYNLLPDSPAYDDIDLQFILGNSLNDLVVKNEEVAMILLDDNKLSLRDVENTILISLVVIVVITFGLFFMVARSEMKFIRRKRTFLDIFFRIKDAEIEENLFIVNAFYVSLIESDREELFMQKVADNNLEMSQRKIEVTKNVRDFKAKSANSKDLDSRTYINLALAFAFMLSFVLLFSILFISFFNHKDLINKLMLRIANTNVNLSQFGLVFASLYEYISEDGTTEIRDEPINKEWESLYTELTSSVDFFNAFNDESSSNNDQILLLLNGDLCPLLYTDRACSTEISGIGKRGILSINGFILKALRETKDFYDSSDQSATAKTNALCIGDFIATEIAYPIYMTRSYAELSSLLNAEFSSEIDNFSHTALKISIIGAVALLILMYFLWIKIISRMEKERVMFRSMLRLIPISVLVTNRYLKSYLISNSKDILDSVKNRI